jgi:peptidoglycan/LPS O-acetylase OafA/YrhL
MDSIIPTWYGRSSRDPLAFSLVWRGSTFCGAVFRLTAVNLFCTGFLGATLLLGSSRFKWIVQRPLLQWFGEISYGLYLFHMLAFDFVDHWIVRFFPEIYPQIPSRFSSLAVGFSFLSRKYFEERFLKLKERWTRPSSHLPPVSATASSSNGIERRTA